MRISPNSPCCQYAPISINGCRKQSEILIFKLVSFHGFSCVNSFFVKSFRIAALCSTVGCPVLNTSDPRSPPRFFLCLVSPSQVCPSFLCSWGTSSLDGVGGSTGLDLQDQPMAPRFLPTLQVKKNRISLPLPWSAHRHAHTGTQDPHPEPSAEAPGGSLPYPHLMPDGRVSERRRDGDGKKGGREGQREGRRKEVGREEGRREGCLHTPPSSHSLISFP